MRVVHLVPNLNFGGLQEVVKGLALGLRLQGHDVTIACWEGPGNHPETEQDLQEAGVIVNVFRRPGDSLLSIVRNLRALLKRQACQVLHVHNPFNYYFYGTVAARLAGVPVVVDTLHIAATFDRMNRREKTLFWASAMMSDRIISICAETHDILGRRFPLPAGRKLVIENGIDVAHYLTVPPRRPHDEFVFGNVGRMVTMKDQRVLIEAFALTRRSHPKIRLRLLGGGPLEPALRQQVRDLGLNDVVEFCGFSHDVAGFLGSLDVFVMSSNKEGMPLSLLEAIASGLPVVATEVGAMPDIVRRCDCGWLCPPRNPQALRAAMDAAITSPDLRERGERARQVVAGHYSTGRMVADHERLYLTLLGEHGAGN